MKLYAEERMREIRKEFEAKILDRPEVATKKMFGCPSYTAKGKLFAFLVTKGIVLTKLSDDERVDALNLPDSMLFEHNNRIVKKWIRVSIADNSDLNQIMDLVEKSYENALTMDE